MLAVGKPVAILRRPSDQPGIPRRSLGKILAGLERGVNTRKTQTALETRISLVLALASQAFSQTQRVPDLETVNFRVVKQTDQYVIREVETCLGRMVLTSMVLLKHSMCWLHIYLNTLSEQMEMTTPVYTRKVRSDGEKMDMTTPVITKQSGEKWQMSFVMPRKYGSNLPLPKDPSVTIKQVPGKTVAVTAFPGFVTDEDVKRRESKLRDALNNDAEFQVKRDAMVEVAQFNPPFTLPFTRRNEISLEVERRTI
ncbi:heme-binding-like protein At3g10130, chloroplastic isoform X5 [Dendrobium catenatum]|uniref:heme-binding-like protein At3g10130, chloroplastic isoform X5 n=1 Tax=Dendrobium catenatum TaxID=906689 RepID=UPI0010A0738E|nr:heme-binding-like protein At3g10130, chloroplastic isoform X5 [Dendrobium catenatum]